MSFGTVAAVASTSGDETPLDLPYQPWIAGEFRWRLGLRPLAIADWIEIGDDYDAQLAAKSAARANHPDSVFVALPEADEACREVRDAVIDHVVARWPVHFERHADSVTNHRTGERVPLDGTVHPLDVAGRLVQEDLVVMVPVDGRLVFAAGSVCLPNRWDLRSKLGHSLAEVHAPVSRLNEQLGDPIDKVFQRLTPDKAFWRLGWGVIDTADPYQPVDGTAALRPAEPTVEDVHVRVERETLRMFPRTGGVLFTIRTYLARLSDVALDAESAARLADAIAHLPDDVRDYKQVDRLAPVLAEVLGRPVR